MVYFVAGIGVLAADAAVGVPFCFDCFFRSAEPMGSILSCLLAEFPHRRFELSLRPPQFSLSRGAAIRGLPAVVTPAHAI